MTLLPLHLVFVCLAINAGTEGRIVRGIIGRNVTFSMTFDTGDLIHIKHNDSEFVKVWPDNKNRIKNHQPNRVGVVIGDTTWSNTVNVTITIMNLTKTDTGMYNAVRAVNPTEIQNSIILEIIDETLRPNIEIFSNHSLDSTLVLKCNVSSTSTVKFSWSLNGSWIEDHTKYFQNNTFLYIRNLTVDDKYNVYTCKKSGSELESDPYSIQIWIDLYTTKATTLSKDTQETNHYTTQTFRKKKDTEGISTYTMTATSSNVNVEDSLSERHVLYIIFGLGGIIAAAFIACFLHTKKICVRGGRGSHSNTVPTSDGNENVQEVNLAECYWTIVSNANDKMSTAIEMGGELSRESPLVGLIIVPTSSESDESTRADDIYVSQEIYRYSNPIISCTMEFNDYIHPIHSDPLNKYMLSEVKESQVSNVNMSIRRDIKAISI